MVKVRPVVVISPRSRGGQLVTVVPLSSVAPTPLHPWHFLLPDGVYPRARAPLWAKCDMIAVVGLARLDRVKVHDATGRRTYQVPQLGAAELEAIRKGVKAALGLA
jgi:uncharacterized protein YifN (PemK superfamily)